MNRKAMKVIDSAILNSADLQPLKQLAAVRMAIPICESEDVQCMIRSFSKINGDSSRGFSDDQWKELCTKVRNKLEQINVPYLLIEIILKRMWPISFEISKWILCHDSDMGIDSSSKFYWTPLLTINYKKTTKMLIKNETIDIKNRFKLACFYCLDVEVRTLWDMMSLPEKRYFFVRGNLKKPELNPIVLYWTYYIQEVSIDYWESKNFNHKQLFIYAVENGYLYATKFFLRKIETRLRNRMVLNRFSFNLVRLFWPRMPTAKSSHFVTAFFLISECSLASLGSRGEMTINLVFRCFLEWPWQNHFMSVFDRLEFYIRHVDVYGVLLKAILEKEMGGFKDYDYKKLFMEFWRRIPEEYKIQISERTTYGFDIFFRFVKKYFRFILEQTPFTLKAKFRFTILQWDMSEGVSYFEQEYVEFFVFLLRERVTTKASIRRISNDNSMYSSDEESESSYNNMSLVELMYLVDIIVRNK